MSKLKVLYAALAAGAVPWGIVFLWTIGPGLSGDYSLTEENYLKFLRGAFIGSFGHVLFLGVPMGIFLIRRKWLRWWIFAIAGFVAASIPIGIYTWPYWYAGISTHSSPSINEAAVGTFVDGGLTAAAWWSWIGNMRFIGSFGVVGAVSGYAILWVFDDSDE
ncbi:hypothetical protein GCM10027276_07840 [Comamonas piscis]